MWHLYHLRIRGTHGSDTKSRDMTMTLDDRLSMVYTGDEGQELFTSHAWMSDTEMGLDVADTLCFKLGCARRRMTWRYMDWGTANVLYLLAQYLFRHAEGRKSGARLEFPLIDLHELGRLNICLRVGDTWAWVALGPEKQQAAAAGAPGAAKDTLVVDEGAQAVPAPVQAP
ncbi:hypothetical protein Tco_1298930 [Tanacetum coccineum]